MWTSPRMVVAMTKKVAESNASESVWNPCKVTATMDASKLATVVIYTITDISFESLSTLIFIFRVFIASTSAPTSTKKRQTDKNITHEKERNVKQLTAR